MTAVFLQYLTVPSFITQSIKQDWTGFIFKCYKINYVRLFEALRQCVSGTVSAVLGLDD